MNNLTFAICLVIGFFIVLGVGSFLDTVHYKKLMAAKQNPEERPNYSGNFMLIYIILAGIVSIVLKFFNLID